ncbi:hypothetical protein QTH91_13185 [Variovorax dokdonensis]|uniref:DUF721 domain-containing protein n=1 Tax=Variovorax dokdonensis TaxID=344883 RepID=A0ABT7NBZ7_9BURK|nr:hypothetical protein [Variovorax dokdonensis]MDM0045442.1 hypothetical protein [Variovorax dokdonensis]
MSSSNRRNTSFTLQQAADASPALAGLAERARDAAERLKAIEDLIPLPLRSSLAAGPADGEEWCLLVQGNAAAAKLRQMTPMLVNRLRQRGWNVTTLRLKIRSHR